MARRHHRVLTTLLVAATACGGRPDLEGDAAAPDSDGGDETPRWRIETPAVDLAPAEEGYYCSYHRIPGDLGPIGRIASYGFAGVHDLALEIVSGPVDDGAVDQLCARPPRTALLFSIERQLGELVLPEDAPLLLGGELAVVVRIHFLNPDDLPKRSQAIISWYGAVTATSQTSGLVSAVRTDFAVPPGDSTIDTFCTLAAGVRLVAAYPVSHGLGYRLEITDQSGPLVDTFEWAHPTRATWQPPYYLPPGQVRTRCEYRNLTGQTVLGGDRLVLDERCGMSALVVPGSGVSECSP